VTSERNIRKLKRWLLPSILLVLVIALVIFWIRIPSLLITRLQDYTHNQSEGKYELSISDINRSLFPFSVTLKEVNLEPAALNISDPELIPEEILYSLGATEIQLKGLNLRLLLTKNILSGKKVKITKPKINLAGEELLKVDTLNISTEFFKTMWPLFGFVEKVELNTIEFEEANFNFYSAAGDSNFISKAEKVSVDVLNFVTSSAMASVPDKYFETEDILVRLNDFRNDMGDSLHTLTIDTLLYSLKTTDIRIKGLHLLPITFQQEENIYEVNVPEVYVKSRSITHFALSDSLKIGFLEFSRPSIRFFQKAQPRKIVMEDFQDFDLYSLIKNQFIKAEVDSFYLHEANVELFRQPDTKSYNQQFQSIDVVLHGFVLDSTSYLNKEKLFHANDLEMRVKGYHLKMKDEVHHFRAGSLFASTFANRLNAADIEIHPENTQNHNIRNVINIECKSLNLEEVNFLDLYHKSILPTNLIEVTEPNVHLLYQLEKKKQKKQSDEGLLFEVVTDYLEGVYANSVRVIDGRLEITNSHQEIVKGYFETNIDFNLAEFRLDSTSVNNSGNFFYASNFDLLFSDYNMRLIDNLHKIEVDTVSISSHHNQIEIENLRLKPVNDDIGREYMVTSGNSELFNISVPQIMLNGVDLKNAFFNHEITIENFNISSPQIYFENYSALNSEDDSQELTDIYELIFSYIKDINVKRFSISGGLLTWINHTRKGRTTSFDNEFSVSLENFRLNETERKNKRLLFSDNFDLTVKDQEFELSDNVHVLKGSEIRFSSSRSMIQITDALLFPLITSDSYNELSTTWQIAIPKVNIEGFDFQKAWYSQEPEIKRLEIISPRFQVYTQPSKTKGLDLKAYSIPMPTFIESLKVSELAITNGRAVTYKKEGSQHSPMASFFFKLSLPGLVLNSNDKNQVKVTSSNIHFSVSDFIVPLDDIHNLQIGSIDFNRERKMIEVLNLRLLPFISDDSHNKFSITAPFISFRGFDFNAALADNDFEFESIVANDPKIALTVNNKIDNDTLEFLQKLDLYPYVEHLVNSVQVNNLDINNAFLNINLQQKQLFNNRLDLSFDGILLSENQSPHNLLNSEAFTISTTQLAANSSDGMYSYTIDTFMYQSPSSTVRMKNIGITPAVDKEEFSLKEGLQTDVAEVKIDYLEFREINERRWLGENILDARALIIGPADIKIYRNKRFPFDHSQRPEWPQDLLQKIKQPFVFDSVRLMPSNIQYSELLTIFDEPGYIEFTDFKFTGNRLSNIPEEIDKLPFRIDAEARLMGEGLLSARFEFDLNSREYKHTVKGSLSPMNVKPFNAMIMKAAPLTVESGRIKRLDFNISFNEESAAGEMFLEYNDLRIAVLDYSGDEINKDWFSSFMANSLKINSQNTGGEYLKPVSISNERDKERSIINFWWKSLYTGIAKVIGI